MCTMYTLYMGYTAIVRLLTPAMQQERLAWLVLVDLDG